MENAKIQKIKWDILSNFQTMNRVGKLSKDSTYLLIQVMTSNVTLFLKTLLVIFNHCERLKVTMHDCCCWPFTRQGTTPCCPKHFLLGGCKQSKHLIATKGD